MAFSPDTIVIHPGELILKGGNRGRFEERLAQDIATRLRPLGGFKVSRRQGVISVSHAEGAFSPELRGAAHGIIERVFGVAGFQFGARCERSLDAIAAVAAAALAEKAPTTFKVWARRSDKTFPMDSQAIAVELGGRLLEAVPGTSVDVHAPQTEIHVAISDEGAFVSTNRFVAPGGLPSGISGKVATLLSGGIDSPVAAWKLARRGTESVFVHFHSYPHVGKESIGKVKRLAGILAQWQRGAVLHLVPLADIQREIVMKADPAMRVILYRRSMLRLAERIATVAGAQALVTGDAVGQVASQTLENLATVSAAVRMPLFRPLIGDNKEDIVGVARRIGTYETSIEPHDDCCSLFMPPRPATRSSAEQAEREESKCAELRALEDAALAATERVVIE
ncbi:MAG: hypothetical protein RLZZ324_558 [Candidatus Parcubacteria bacterium]|jgi:thiamine biosynthesis protein ThiI